MQIHQLQGSYQADQDRIVLRLQGAHGEEQPVWLTRRMLKGMMVHLQRLADHLVTLRQVEVQTTTEERALAPRNAAAAEGTAPLLPLLATALHVSPGDDNSLDIRFDEVHDGESGATRSIEANLRPELLAGLVQLMDAVLRIADWDLRLHIPGSDADGDTLPSPLDAFADAPRPKYLN